MSESPRSRVLLVTRNLPPLVGGMERLNWHMADELTRYADVRIVGPVGSSAVAPQAVATYEVPLKPLWRFIVRGLWRAWRVARAWQPDIVVAGSGLTAPAAWLVARACRARAVVYVHGLDLAVRHPVYRCLWRPALRHMDRVIANSHPTAALARGIGVDPGRIGIVCPGVDLPGGPVERACDAAEPSEVPGLPGGNECAVGSDLRQRYGFGNRPLLLSVGRLSTRKGLREFVVQAMPRIVAVRPDVMLLIVGDAPNDALHARAQTQESIQAAAEQFGLADNLRFLGTIVDYQVLGSIYRAADVHVFPVRDIQGDPEGFGMVAVEAAAHGLPTVAFATGGVVDAVAEGESGHLVHSGDYEGFAQAVLSTLDESGALRGRCKAFAREFAWSEFGRKLAVLLETEEPRPDSAGSMG